MMNLHFFHDFERLKLLKKLKLKFLEGIENVFLLLFYFKNSNKSQIELG